MAITNVSEASPVSGQASPQEGLTFEKVWAALMEDREQMREYRERKEEEDRRLKERMEEENRQLKERMEEEDRRRKEEEDRRRKERLEEEHREKKQKEEADERMRKLDKMMADLNRQASRYHRSFGELAEHQVAPGIAEKFNELGHHFNTIAHGGLEVFDAKRNTLAQVDVWLENSESIIAVEVKSKPKIQDIEHQKRCMKILREDRNKKNDTRKMYGAIAGAVFGSIEKKATIEAGFYVIEQTGDTMKIDIPEGFVPKEW